VLSAGLIAISVVMLAILSRRRERPAPADVADAGIAPTA
jgi:hypothetical protein